MKKLIFSTLFLGLSLMLFGQTQLPNVGYETWTNIAGSNAEPSNWNSNKTGGGFANLGPQTCFPETTNPYNGTYCVRLETRSYLGTPVNGTVTTGRIQAPSTNPNQGYVETVRTDANFNAPFTGRPDSLVGYYRYTSVSGDYLKIEAVLHDNSYNVRSPADASSTAARIGSATFFGPTSTVSNWTRFSVPFNYVSGNNPSYALIIGTSSAVQGGAIVGSILWLDDIQVVYNPTITLGSITAAGPYYVSNTQGTNVSIAYTATGTYAAGNTFTAQLSNASGSFASPVNIGTLSSTGNGTINATIPAGTASGTGYRIRIVSSNPAISSANNGTDITINLCANPVTPNNSQTIATNTNGTPLTANETVSSTSREWKFATVSGGPYSSFTSAQTGTTYTPNFAAAGTYFLICQSNYPGALQVLSNEVTVNVVGNEISPSSAQSILVGVNGNQLTVTETPAGTARVWKFATVSGGPYSNFAPSQTGTTYTPNFASAGTYFVICESTINGLQAISNEVQVSVGSVTISTGTINGSPFEFSASAPNAAVNVPYTVSAPFVTGNIFTAQLSDANGSFASATNIGTLSATNSGTISASIPSTTAAGSGYRIRVIASNPATSGSDNGADLSVDQFNNSIAPTTSQNIVVNQTGTAINVTESQNATRLWKFATVSGGPYTSFGPTVSGTSYTPLFNTPGTFFVVCESTNQYSDAIISNEVTIVVANGNNITTNSASSSPFLTSPSANVSSVVNFSSDAVFNSGNIFTAQISDAFGSFANPINIGTLNGASISNITATIPNNLLSGNAYRIRVVSTNPAIIGTDNGQNLSVIQFENSITPVDTQFVQDAVNGNQLTVSTTHTSTQEWYSRPNIFAPFVPFTPAETGTTLLPNFTGTTLRMVHCRSVNAVGDTVTSNEVIFVISPTSTNQLENAEIRTYWSGNDLTIDLSQSDLSENASFRLTDVKGALLGYAQLNPQTVHNFNFDIPSGIYILHLSDDKKSYSIQMMKR